MRSKLFFSFLAVILLALISNLLYEQFITNDFEEYVNGTKEDRLYWIMASVEGSFADGRPDHMSLHEALHWAIMLGFDVRVLAPDGRQIITSEEALNMVPPSMKKRMASIADLLNTSGDFESYPLYEAGKEVATLLARPISRPDFGEKEALFKQRGKYFLIVSFAIAGGGAIALSFFFSLFFSRPLRKMKQAVDSMAANNFSVRVEAASGDELGDLARSFNYMAGALEREEALRKRLTSNIAHELRTPLAVMKANIEAMDDGVIDRTQGLENIRSETEKLIRLVEGIEDITKAEASFFSARDYTEINLRDLLSSVSSKMQPLALGKGLAMTVSGPDDLMVMTDPEKLERIIQNILSNAIKFTERGSVILSCGPEKGGFFIEVTDTGSGVSKDSIDDIFRRFYRGEKSNGIGLGLSIVKELLDVMGGSVEVSSAEGNGTTFRVWLPVTQ